MQCLIHYHAAERELYLQRKNNYLNVFLFNKAKLFKPSKKIVNMNIVFRLFSHKGMNGEIFTAEQLM